MIFFPQNFVIVADVGVNKQHRAIQQVGSSSERSYQQSPVLYGTIAGVLRPPVASEPVNPLVQTLYRYLNHRKAAIDGTPDRKYHLQPLIPPVHRITLHSWQYMPVNTQRHFNIAVSKYLLDDIRVYSLTQQNRSRAMTQIMKAHRGQSCFFEKT